jgi:hypothetical protein
MSRFMCTHTLPPGAISEAEMRGMAEASQHDPTVKGYRSFANLTEGKVICVVESSTLEAVAAFFKKMDVPVDSITKVEYEAERASVCKAA